MIKLGDTIEIVNYDGYWDGTKAIVVSIYPPTDQDRESGVRLRYLTGPEAGTTDPHPRGGWYLNEHLKWIASDE